MQLFPHQNQDREGSWLTAAPSSRTAPAQPAVVRIASALSRRAARNLTWNWLSLVSYL